MRVVWPATTTTIVPHGSVPLSDAGLRFAKTARACDTRPRWDRNATAMIRAKPVTGLACAASCSNTAEPATSRTRSPSMTRVPCVTMTIRAQQTSARMACVCTCRTTKVATARPGTRAKTPFAARTPTRFPDHSSPMRVRVNVPRGAQMRRPSTPPVVPSPSIRTT